MYQFSYAEVVEDSPKELRARERQALDQAISMLKTAHLAGPGTREMTEALIFLRQLWAIFMDDLQHPENELPQAIRANLLSIGIWIGKEVERIRTGNTSDLSAVIEINEIIKRGLT